MLSFVIWNLSFASEPELITSIPADEPNRMGHSQNPTLSRDGRLVVFESQAAFDPVDANGVWDIYVFDRNEKTMERISPDDAPRVTGGASVSASGRWVTFHSAPRYPSGHEDAPACDIFLFDRKSKRAENISARFSAEAVKRQDLFPALGLESRLLLFTSDSARISGGQPRPLRQIYVFDRLRGRLQRISRTKNDLPANRLCGDAQMSRDGATVVYRSAATNILDDLPEESLDTHLYLYNREKGNAIRLDDRSRGFDPNKWGVGLFAMNRNAQTVVFEGRDRQSKSPYESLIQTDLFLYERNRDMVRRLTEGIFTGTSRFPTLSGDGRYLAFVYIGSSDVAEKTTGLVVYDQVSDLWKQPFVGRAWNPVFSDDSRWIAFESDDPSLSATTKKGYRNIYVLPNPFF